MSSLLRVAGLQKSFRQGALAIEVLRGVDFEARSGDTVAIVGQSGSGKSTLLSLLAGLDRPDRGAVWLDDTEVSALGELELSRFRARHLGIVFQQFHLMSDLTAVENVELPLELHSAGRWSSKEIRRRALEQLVQVGLAARARHLPGELSGGECQRVAVARALVLRPSILLCDEPTGNLDAETAVQVSGTIFSLAQQAGAILLLVTHSDELARRCGRTLRLLRGRIE